MGCQTCFNRGFYRRISNENDNWENDYDGWTNERVTCACAEPAPVETTIQAPGPLCYGCKTPMTKPEGRLWCSIGTGRLHLADWSCPTKDCGYHEAGLAFCSPHYAERYT